MKLDVFRSTVIVLLVITVIAACAPQTPATPTVDVIGTTAAQLAAEMLTQTAGAVTPTPIPPTETATPAFTDTPSAPTEKVVPKSPAVITVASCWKGGPGENYVLSSNIEPRVQTGKIKVTILGIGSEPGWYVIRNPYFNDPCWIKAEYLEIDPNMDMTQFPVMTPGP